MRSAGLRSLVPVLALLLAAGPGACAAGPERKEGLRTIRGVVRVVGNDPFTQVVVTSPGDAAGVADRIDYLVEGPLAAELQSRYQGRTVTLEGTDARPSRPSFRRGFAPTRILGVEGNR